MLSSDNASRTARALVNPTRLFVTVLMVLSAL